MAAYHWKNKKSQLEEDNRVMSGRAPGCQEEPSQLKGKRKSFPNLSSLKLHRCAEVLRAITGAQPPTHPDAHDRRLWQGTESGAAFQGEIPDNQIQTALRHPYTTEKGGRVWEMPL